jgi:myo-inositol-hexaphosphate 3-phosphohydrolase
LKTIEFGFTSNLYEIRLGFTGGAKSVGLKTRSAQATDESTNLKSYTIDPNRRIADVYILQDTSRGNIYGFRLLDEFGEYLVNANWFESDTAQWKHFRIPTGKEIIGMHGTHDGDYIMSLGLTLWKPNPDAKLVVRESIDQKNFR